MLHLKLENIDNIDEAEKLKVTYQKQKMKCLLG